MEQSPVSVIIAVKDGARTIAKTVDSLLLLDYPKVEIIVVDDGSKDATPGILKGYGERVRVITTEGVGPSKARNLGIEAASGEYVAFTDGDCIVATDWLAELMKGFACGENVGGVGGDQQSPADDTEFGKHINRFMKSIGFVTDYIKPAGCDPKIVETSHNPTCNAVYKKEVFAKAGGFQEGLWPGEDVELDYRVRRCGYRLLFNPLAVVYHYRPDSLKRFKRMMFSYGKVQAFLIRQYGFFRVIHYVPLCFAALILTLAALLACLPLLFIVALLALAAFEVAYFALKAPRQVLRYSFLGIVTVLYWHGGFAAGLVERR